MKKFFLMLALCLGVSIANAQNVGFYVDDGMVLNGNQWHYDNLSIIDAGNLTYLVITPTEYYYSTLPAFDALTINSFLHDVSQSYRPYIWNGYLGWLVYARYGVYFVYQWGNSWHYARIDTEPVYYNYYYNLCGLRYIDMRIWHFAPPLGPRPHHHHHGTPAPYSGHHQGTPPPVKPNGGGYGSGSQRGSGTTVRPSNPPTGGNGSVRPPTRPNGNGSARPSNPPSGSNRGTTVRPVNPPSGGSRSGGYTPGSRRSSSGSFSGTVSRPPSGSRGTTPTPRPAGGSSRRR